MSIDHSCRGYIFDKMYMYSGKHFSTGINVTFVLRILLFYLTLTYYDDDCAKYYVNKVMAGINENLYKS